ncbi:hypothetical protein V8B97DRAFT_1503961 [Scleroderma yunnanense]
MVAETNRKRRKLERERRAMERPVGARGFPVAILNPPPAPTLREIANTTPLPSHLAHLVSSTSKKPSTRPLVTPSLNAGLGVGFNGLGPNATAYPDLPALTPADIATDLDYLFQHRRAGFGYSYGMFPAVSGVGFPGVGPGIGPGVGFGPGAGGVGFNSVPGVGFGINGVGPAEMYPPGPGPGMAPPPLAGPPMPLPQSHPGMTGPGVGSADSPGFGQPSTGVFQPSVGRENAYPLGPSGSGLPQGGPATSGRTQRPPGPILDREREGAPQRERELVARDRDREFSQREHDRERVGEMNNRERERDREFGSNAGPRYQSSEWNPKPSGGLDWGLGDRRREEDLLERERERERVERLDRERTQVQPMTAPPIPRHQNQHSHPHPHHPHPSHPQHHPSHPSHLNHPAHSQPPHTHSHHQHQHSHPLSQHPHQHTQHPHGPTGAAPHHHHGQHYHHRHHHHVVHHHHSSGPESRTDVEGPGTRRGQGQGQTSTHMEIINLSTNSSSKALCKREEGKFGGSSLPASRPSSTHPPFVYDERERDRDRDKDRDRDRPVATPFVLGPSHNSLSAASSPRHNWPHGDMGGPHLPGAPGGPFPPASERFHSPVPGSSGATGAPHRFSNPPSHLHRRSPSSLTTSPSRSGPPASPTSVNLVNPGGLSSSMNTSSSPGPFPHARKPSPILPPPSKLGMSSLVYSPRLAGPGVLPPTGPGVPGVLSGSTAGPGVPGVLSGPPGIPPSGILTSGPGMPPVLAMSQGSSGPGIGGSMGPGGPGVPIGLGDGHSRTGSPMISFTSPRVGAGVPPAQKIGVEGV